jgi:hypothetical protein
MKIGLFLPEGSNATLLKWGGAGLSSVPVATIDHPTHGRGDRLQGHHGMTAAVR